MARQIRLVPWRLLFLLAVSLTTTSCLSMLIPEDNEPTSAFTTRKNQLDQEMSANTAKAKQVLAKEDAAISAEKAVKQCSLAIDKFYERQCYVQLFTSNSNKSVCEKIKLYELAQYECYRSLRNLKDMPEAKAVTYCTDNICLAAYLSLANRNYTKDKYPQLMAGYSEHMKLSTMGQYSDEQTRIGQVNNRRYTFDEVLYVGARTNRSITLGYDLGFHGGGSPFGIGLSSYDLIENVYAIDFALSGAPSRGASGRFGLGTELKNGRDNYYHAYWGLGYKGITPTLEIRSNFKKDHEFNLGIFYLYQVPRRK